MMVIQSISLSSGNYLVLSCISINKRKPKGIKAKTEPRGIPQIQEKKHKSNLLLSNMLKLPQNSVAKYNLVIKGQKL